MKLTRLEIQNYRSIFADSSGRQLTLDLGDGVNSIVGPNNCGKSNIFRALAVALDPDFVFDRKRDMPATANWAKPTITLTLQVPTKGRTSPERTLLKYLDEYERVANPKARETFASQGIVRYRVTIEGGDASSGTRRETFVASGAGARSLPSDEPRAIKALEQFRRCFHFVLIQSGQSLSSLLEGKFRDILRSVLREQLSAEYATAEKHRAEYVTRIQDGLLQPLTNRIGGELKDLFPEVTGVILRPHVGSLESTLTSMQVDVTDTVSTDLADKGTGVRGGVLVAMLRHIADSGKRSMLFAVEEPEAFLHPAAQESLREDLEKLAERSDVSLLITTHSPFVVSREQGAMVFALEKDSVGRTAIVGSAPGAQPHAGVLGGLFRDRLVLDVLDRAAKVPQTATAIVVVEGTTDEDYLRLAVERIGRPGLIADLAFVHAGTGVVGSNPGGAALAVMQALVAKATTGLPVVALFDNDEPGRESARMLREIGTKTGDWNKKTVLTYASVFDGSYSDFPFEAEELWPNHVYESFLADRGEAGFLSSKRKLPGSLPGWKFDLEAKAKGDFVDHLRMVVAGTDCHRFVELVEKIRSSLGLPPEAVAPLPSPAADPVPVTDPAGGKARTIWPLPGGGKNWNSALGAMLGRLASGSAKVDELIEWTKAEFSTVNSDKTARGYWQVPVSLGFAQVRAGVFAVTEEGRAFASSPESSALAAALASSVWGVAEMLEYLAESPATLDQLNEYLNSLGAGWKTSAQVLYRVGWLQTAGLIVQGADGLWKSA